MSVEIESVEQLEVYLGAHPNLQGVVLQGLDLSAHGALITASSAQGVTFLGCTFTSEVRDHVLATGGLVFPSLPDLPYEPYRPTLYCAEDLSQGYVHGDPSTLKASLDQRVYAHYDAFRKASDPVPILETLAQRLHDHAIDDALEDFLCGGDADGPRKVVAIMGGHGMKRRDPNYRKVARIAYQLTKRGFVMATGGGPGAMEATNLGAWMAGHPIEMIDQALALLERAPDYKHPEWWDSAIDVRKRFSEAPGESLGIPTWYYGHEPPNLFATHIAKYFSNSLREDGLLTIAHHGVVYAPGSAGTIQEVFMDACQNHYGTFGDVSAMVFLGREYWTKTKPVYPLLRSLAQGRHYGELLGIEDEEEAVVDFIVSHPPQVYRGP